MDGFLSGNQIFQKCKNKLGRNGKNKMVFFHLLYPVLLQLPSQIASIEPREIVYSWVSWTFDLL